MTENEMPDEMKDALRGTLCSDKYPDKNAQIHPDAKKINEDPADLWHRCPHCGLTTEAWW